jgi:hypothetical protein
MVLASRTPSDVLAGSNRYGEDVTWKSERRHFHSILCRDPPYIENPPPRKTLSRKSYRGYTSELSDALSVGSDAGDRLIPPSIFGDHPNHPDHRSSSKVHN